jgi:hypothetical protein
MHFRIIGPIEKVEVIAIGSAIRTLKQIQRRFGRGRWRKLKGVATVELEDETLRRAEVHWYEAHGIGKVMMKIKRYVD